MTIASLLASYQSGTSTPRSVITDLLKRLRADCATRSDATAMELLKSYVVD